MTMRMDRFSLRVKKRLESNAIIKSDYSDLSIFNNEVEDEIITNKAIRDYERSTHKNPKAKLLNIDICSN
jgi:hypothetical protein